MHEVLFYRDESGFSDLVAYLDDLGRRAQTSKRDRVLREKILSYIGALAEYGTRLGAPMVKHLEGEIWELRPLSDRILFFGVDGGRFVLLSYFTKKSQKTPQRELAKARRRMRDYLERSHG